MDNREKLKIPKKPISSAIETPVVGQLGEAKRLGKKIVYSVKKAEPAAATVASFNSLTAVVAAPKVTKKAKKLPQPEPDKAAIAALRQAKAARGIEWLVEHYPKLFNPSEKKPLALGIHKQLFAANTGVPCRLLAAGLKGWVQTADYCQAVLTHAQRYTLQGEPCGTVTEQERAYAEQFLASQTCQK